MKANSKPYREIIYNKIIEDLTKGKINPGEKLTEAQLARQFNVSRTPVREALLQLEKKGIVICYPNVGAVVKKITTRRIEEVFNLISVLEGYAVETAMSEGFINDEDISYLKELRSEMEDLAKAKNYFLYAEKDAEFHSFLVRKSGNKALEETVKDLRSKIYTVGITLPFYVDRYLLRHQEIIDEISKGNTYRAGNVMKEHVQEIKGFLIEMVGKFRGISAYCFEEVQK
jgi:DNA-binding GntR family transcriptional regulator